jgi:mannose-6-phosphate isomerase-like protein (cupin superfamily)
MPEHEHSDAVVIDLVDRSGGEGHSGPRWSHESDDLDLTLLTWRGHERIAAHVNREVDVVLIVVAGEGEVVVNGATHRLSAGQAILIPKGTERAIRCAGDRFSYLSLHRRRRGLWPSVRGDS